MNELKEVVLEPSSNTHKLTAKNVKVEKLENSKMLLEIEGEGLISHGEHGTLKTESKHCMKFNQTELNPVTQKLQNAFD